LERNERIKPESVENEKSKLELPKPRKLERLEIPSTKELQDKHERILLGLPERPKSRSPSKKAEKSPQKERTETRTPEKVSPRIQFKDHYQIKFHSSPNKQRALRSKGSQIIKDPVQAKIEFLNSKSLTRLDQETDDIKKIQREKFFTENAEENIRRLARVRAYKLGQIKDTDLIKYPKINMNSADILLNKFMDHKERLELVQEQLKDPEQPTSASQSNIKIPKYIELPNIHYDDAKIIKKTLKKGLGLSYRNALTEHSDDPYLLHFDEKSQFASLNNIDTKPLQTSRIYSPQHNIPASMPILTLYSPKLNSDDAAPKKVKKTMNAAELKKKVFKKAPKQPLNTSQAHANIKDFVV